MKSALGSNGSTSKWLKIRKRILLRDNYTCAYCGVPDARTVDHIVPRSAWPEGVPGVDEDSNLVVACASCNSRKGNSIRATNEAPKPRKGRQW